MLIKVDKAKRVRGPFSFTCFPIPAPFAGRDVSDRREGEDDVFVNVSPYIESAPEKPKEAFCEGNVPQYRPLRTRRVENNGSRAVLPERRTAANPIMSESSPRSAGRKDI